MTDYIEYTPKRHGQRPPYWTPDTLTLTINQYKVTLLTLRVLQVHKQVQQLLVVQLQTSLSLTAQKALAQLTLTYSHSL